MGKVLTAVLGNHLYEATHKGNVFQLSLPWRFYVLILVDFYNGVVQSMLSVNWSIHYNKNVLGLVYASILFSVASMFSNQVFTLGTVCPQNSVGNWDFFGLFFDLLGFVCIGFLTNRIAYCQKIFWWTTHITCPIIESTFW